MPGNFTTSSAGSRDSAASQLTIPSSRPWTPLRVTGYFSILSLALFILGEFNHAIRSTVVLPTATPTYRLTKFPLASDEQNVQHQASLIRDNLPAYLNFVGSEVLPDLFIS